MDFGKRYIGYADCEGITGDRLSGIPDRGVFYEKR
jgi:hypothetical protein